jgi:prevent-host-death family protein
MSYLAVSPLDKDLNKLMDEVIDFHEPAIIVKGKNAAVLVAIEDWEEMQETVFIASNKELSDSIIEGLNTPLEECIKEEDLPDEFAWLRDRNKNV